MRTALPQQPAADLTGMVHLSDPEAAPPPAASTPAEAAPPEYMPLNLFYPGLKKVHQKPPIYVCEGFLTDEERDAFIRVAGPLLQRSKTHAIAGTAQPPCCTDCSPRLAATWQQHHALLRRIRACPTAFGLTCSLPACPLFIICRKRGHTRAHESHLPPGEEGLPVPNPSAKDPGHDK